MIGRWRRGNILGRLASKSAGPLRGLSLGLTSTPNAPLVAAVTSISETPQSWSTASAPSAAGDEYSQHRRLVATLSQIPNKVAELESMANVEEGIYREDATIAASARSGLFYRQLKIEEEQLQDAAHNYISSLKNIMELGRGTGMKHVQKIVLKWYEPLHSAIEREKKLVLSSVSAKDRQQYGPVLLLLSTEKLAVITLNSTLNMILRTGNIGIQLVSVAKQIGELVEAEVNITKLQVGTAQLPLWQQNIIKESYDDASKYRRSLSKRVRLLLNEEAWSQQIKVKLGAALIKLLIESSKNEDGEEVFLHTSYFYASVQRRLGILRMDSSIFKAIAERELNHVLPRYLPMLVPPKAWNNKFRSGCYFRLRTSLMRTFSPSHMDSLKRAEMGPILEGLNYLGQVPWRINGEMLQIIREAMEKGISIGELPPKTNVPMPLETDCYRIPSKISKPSRASTAAAKRKGINSSAEAPFKQITTNQGESIEPSPPSATTPNPHDSTQPIFDEKLYKELCRRVKMKNAELHSLRCDLQLKIWVAEKFEDDRIYYPHNLDFRGRAYPVPQNLSHLGSDLCRGLLTFEEAKPLGEIGLDWLKVQLANLFGNNKNSLRDRVNWVDQHMDEVYDSAKHPLDGKRWWTTAEEPFQSLATCIEIVKAIESGDPTTYMSSMPIHQDGSCNGLQHYAALGRDEPGAIAVNLTPSDSPQDVYSKVLEIVQARIDVDVNIPEDALDPRERERGKLARTVQNVVNRKVIKQTVMTSVYGVTKIGARAQVQARLEERMMNDPSTVKSPEADREIFEASRFVFLILPLALHIKFLTVFSLSHIHTHSHNQMQISCGSYIE